jgi:hypothetical protein
LLAIDGGNFYAGVGVIEREGGAAKAGHGVKWHRRRGYRSGGKDAITFFGGGG